MEYIETEYNGIKLKGEIICHEKWHYSVRLIEPRQGWESGCNIPNYAKITGRDFLGEVGYEAMKSSIIEMYKKLECFYRDEPRFRRIYKDYKQEVESIQGIDTKVRDRIIRKLNMWVMDVIYGHGNWNIYDEEETFKLLSR